MHILRPVKHLATGNLKFSLKYLWAEHGKA